MNLNLSSHPEIQTLIDMALKEDIASGDVTSLSVIPPEVQGAGVFISRGSYVVSGNEVAAAVFSTVDPAIQTSITMQDGSAIEKGETCLEISGPLASILTAERTALNFMQRMTGSATMARAFMRRVEGTGVVVLDTRKTTPGMRLLEKYAVRCGGATNHRMGLYDRVMLKDNHLLGWQEQDRSLPEAVRIARKENPDLVIEVEADTPEQVRELVEADPDWILLDNMTLEQLRTCVEICRGKCKTEASGGVNLDTVRAIAETGVDAVSVGALTHSVVAADLSLDVVV